MEISADPLPGGANLSAQVVIIGAGPAGIVTALELADDGIEVLLIESGRWKPSPELEGILEPEFTTPAHVLSNGSRRQVGGTTVIWGGRCVPFDRVDFDRRPYVGHSQWPITYEEVSAFHERACDYLHCGAAVFDALELPELSKKLLAPDLVNGEVRASDLERWSLPTNFGKEYRARLKRHRRIRLVTGLTCVEVVSQPSGSAVAHLRCVGRSGQEITVRGEEYVLATGGLEATRLLLSSDRLHRGGMGNHSDHLGRWYMSHTDGSIAQIEFSGDPRQTIIAHERDADRVYVRRRLSISREAQHKHQLPNIVAWPVNPDLADAAHGNGALSSAYLTLTSRLGHRLAPDPFRRPLTHQDASPKSEHARNVMASPLATAGFILSLGYRRFVPWRRAPGFFVRTADNRYPLNYHGEQVPTRESRITLTSSRDGMGMRRPLVDLRFTDQDIDGVVRAHELWDSYLQRKGGGRLIFDEGGSEDSVNRQLKGGCHHIGTTRMSLDPRDGVLTPDLTVHGVDNLSVVSSSAFCSSSQANPTLLVVVLALRRADALRDRFRRAWSARRTSPALDNSAPQARDAMLVKKVDENGSAALNGARETAVGRRRAG